MARMYRNFLNGTTTNNPLLIGGTTLTSANVAALPEVVAPDLLVLVLDPDASAGAPEIVYVSAHTVASTSATIIRGQEGTVAREHASGTVWRHAATTEDFERLDDIDTSIASLQAADTSLDGRLDAIEANDWVTSARIAADAVGSSEIAAGAVGTAEIADSAVTSAKIADGTIVSGDLADSAVTTAKINDSAVTSAKIADGTIATGDIADSAVTDAKITAVAATKLTGTLGAAVYGQTTSFTPSWYCNNTAVTIGNGSAFGYYFVMGTGAGSMVYCIIETVFGSTSSLNGASGTFEWTLPSSFTIDQGNTGQSVLAGGAVYLRSGVGRYAYGVTSSTTTRVAMTGLNGSLTTVTNTSPNTIGTSDVYRLEFWFRRAS